MRKYRKPSEIKLVELILTGSEIITGTPEYKRLLEISRSYLANTLICASTPAGDMLERYTYQYARRSTNAVTVLIGGAAGIMSMKM